MPESLIHYKMFRRFVRIARMILSLVLLVLEIVRRFLDL